MDYVSSSTFSTGIMILLVLLILIQLINTAYYTAFALFLVLVYVFDINHVYKAANDFTKNLLMSTRLTTGVVGAPATAPPAATN